MTSTDVPDAPDAAGFAALLARITRERGFQCSSYKDRCLRRRISARMRARGTATFAAYERLLDVDAAEYERLVDALTVNVTKLFRNWDAWDALARYGLPTLVRDHPADLRFWSAGTASGEEAYSLAALLHRVAGDAGRPERASRAIVLGTDLDRASLAAAEMGKYAAPAFADTPAELRARYFVEGDAGAAAVVPEVRAAVRFLRHDLLCEPAPVGPWHLIACRNVLIYFDRESQQRLITQLADALVPGGLLFLGKVETLLGDTRARFAPVDHRQRIYRRLPNAR